MGKLLAHRLALLTEATGKTPSFLYLFGPRLRGKFGSQGLAWINGFEMGFETSDLKALRGSLHTRVQGAPFAQGATLVLL